MIKIIALVTVFTICSLSLKAQTDSSFVKDNFDTFYLTELHNIWDITQNPVKILFVESKQLASSQIGYSHSKGDYHNVFDSKENDVLEVNANGYSKPKKVSYYGNFNYFYQTDYDQKWNNTSMIAPLNPFILGDSIGGMYTNENYLLNGSIATQIGESNTFLGVDIDYNVGKKSNTSDPRPRITSMRSAIRPGILVKHEKFNWGVNIEGALFKEEVEITSDDHYENYRHFGFMGFGKRRREVDSYYNRKYTGYKVGGAIQSEYKGNKLTNISEVGAYYEYERSQDGGISNIYLSGDYSAVVFNVNNKIRFSNCNSYKDINIRLNLNSVKGVWFDQNSEEADDGTTYYVIYNQSIKYKRTLLNGYADYTYTHLSKSKRDYSIYAGALFTADISNFYPEQFYKNIYSFTPKIGAEKLWYKRRIDASIKANASYRYNVDNDIFVKDIELIDLITYPEFYYLTSNLINVSASFRVGFPQLLKKMYPYFVISGGSMFASGNDVYNHTMRYNISGKFNLTF